MADLTGGSDSRGQLLIVTAIGLAVLLVLMALALNTAVVGEIHVAQAADSLQGERGAAQYEDAVRRGVADLVDTITDEDEYDLEDDLKHEVAVWNELAAPAYARDGVATNVSVDGLVTVVVQDDSRAFTSADGNDSWTVAEDVSDVRGYEMTIAEEDLVETDDCTADGDCFSLTVDGSWRLFAYKTPGDGDIVVEVDASDSATCRTSDQSVSIDITGGTFDHPDCDDEFTPFRDDSGVDAPYTLAYDNGNNASGTYDLAVDGGIDDDARYGADGESPRLEHAVAVALEYRTVSLEYETTVWVSTGEDDG